MVDSFSCTADERTLLDWLQNETFSVTLGKRDGTPTNVQIPVAVFPPNVLQAVFAYGVQRKFNDSVGGADKSIEDKVAGVNALIDQFKKGEVRAARVAGEAVDPFIAAVRAVLRPLYKAAWVKKNSAEGWKALEESDIVDAIDVLFANMVDPDLAKVTAAANAKMEADRIARDGRKGLTLSL